MSDSSPMSESALPLHAAARLDRAVTLLRRRLEQHLDSESRLQNCYRRWQSQWSQQCAQATRSLAMLEAQLSAWMPHAAHQHPLTVVAPSDAD